MLGTGRDERRRENAKRSALVEMMPAPFHWRLTSSWTL